MEKEYIDREMLIDILNAKAEMAQGTPKEYIKALTEHGLMNLVENASKEQGRWG